MQLLGIYVQYLLSTNKILAFAEWIISLPNP